MPLNKLVVIWQCWAGKKPSATHKGKTHFFDNFCKAREFAASMGYNGVRITPKENK